MITRFRHNGIDQPRAFDLEYDFGANSEKYKKLYIYSFNEHVEPCGDIIVNAIYHGKKVIFKFYHGEFVTSYLMDEYSFKNDDMSIIKYKNVYKHIYKIKADKTKKSDCHYGVMRIEK